MLSGELIQKYKPDPEVYLMASRLLGVEASQLMLVAAHPSDLRAYEVSDDTRWSTADRAWASRVAVQAVGAQAPADAYIAARAHAALQRLAALDQRLARWSVACSTPCAHAASAP